MTIPRKAATFERIEIAGPAGQLECLRLDAATETPLGIVYATDAKAEPKVRVVDTFAANLHPPVVYPAAVVVGKRNPATQALLDYLGSAEAGAVWGRHGFGTFH